MTELKAIPLFADEQIKSLKDFTDRQIPEIRKIAMQKNRKKYESTMDAESSAELATAVPMNLIMSVVNQAQNTVESVVSTHYQEEFSEQMTIQQIEIVVTNCIEQIEHISKQYLIPTRLDNESFEFYK